MSFLDKMKKASKSVVDAGAKQMLKVRSWAVRIHNMTRMTMIMSSVVHVQNSFFFPCPRLFFVVWVWTSKWTSSLFVMRSTCNNKQQHDQQQKQSKRQPSPWSYGHLSVFACKITCKIDSGLIVCCSWLTYFFSERLFYFHFRSLFVSFRHTIFSQMTSSSLFTHKHTIDWYVVFRSWN